MSTRVINERCEMICPHVLFTGIFVAIFDNTLGLRQPVNQLLSLYKSDKVRVRTNNDLQDPICAIKKLKTCRHIAICKNPSRSVTGERAPP